MRWKKKFILEKYLTPVINLRVYEWASDVNICELIQASLSMLHLVLPDLHNDSRRQRHDEIFILKIPMANLMSRTATEKNICTAY